MNQQKLGTYSLSKYIMSSLFLMTHKTKANPTY